jgi:hypothetical protein
MNSLVTRDEREQAIDLAADRISFLVVAYGALLLAAYRSFVLDEAAWDLLGLVVVGGAAGLVYRLRGGVTNRRWTMVLGATVALAAVAAALIALGVGR